VVTIKFFNPGVWVSAMSSILKQVSRGFSWFQLNGRCFSPSQTPKIKKQYCNNVVLIHTSQQLKGKPLCYIMNRILSPPFISGSDSGQRFTTSWVALLVINGHSCTLSTRFMFLINLILFALILLMSR